MSRPKVDSAGAAVRQRFVKRLSTPRATL